MRTITFVDLLQEEEKKIPLKREQGETMKSLNGLAKGTSLEKMTEMLAMGEAKGAMMYLTLARLAREQGFGDASKKFTEAAFQEANHSAFFAELMGMYPLDFWGLVRGLQKAEEAGEGGFLKLAQRFRAEGMAAAADELEFFAGQEAFHGAMLKELLAEYGQNNVDMTGKKVYVCAVCGYEYVGDLDAESDDFVCPVCGQPKKVFHMKQ